jgi:purine nucleosidase
MYMKRFVFTLSVFFLLNLTAGCMQSAEKSSKIRVLFDTDANNELDDQHALAYLLFNGDIFDVVGVTVNATRNGGDIHEQYLEAERVMRLCNQFGKIPLLKGANGTFEEIRANLKNTSFDGSDAVNFIVEQARAASKEKLVLLPVGKLTNIALALEKDPSIAEKVRIVWLGSNFPKPGEYNQDNDIAAMNYILSLNVSFEMVVVRYNDPSGTDAVRVTPEEIRQRMPGIGPKIKEPVIGRHGGEFFNFGDYSVSLFKNIRLYGDPPSRSLFDMAAVAIVKNAAWASQKVIPAPVYIDHEWIEQFGNERKIIVWENFDQDAIMKDFYSTMENYVLVKP